MLANNRKRVWKAAAKKCGLAGSCDGLPSNKDEEVLARVHRERIKHKV